MRRYSLLTRALTFIWYLHSPGQVSSTACIQPLLLVRGDELFITLSKYLILIWESCPLLTRLTLILFKDVAQYLHMYKQRHLEARCWCVFGICGEIWACSRCLPAVTVMQRGIYSHLSSVGIMRKTALKTGRRTWRSEENREVLAQNRSHLENTRTYILQS